MRSNPESISARARDGRHQSMHPGEGAAGTAAYYACRAKAIVLGSVEQGLLD